MGGRQRTRYRWKRQRQNICARSGCTTECKDKDKRRANMQGLQGVGGRARPRAVPAQPARPQRRAAFLSQLCPGAPSYRSLPHKPTFHLYLNFWTCQFDQLAKVWCGASRPEALQSKLKTAVHAPGKYRCPDEILGFGFIMIPAPFKYVFIVQYNPPNFIICLLLWKL